MVLAITSLANNLSIVVSVVNHTIGKSLKTYQNEDCTHRHRVSRLLFMEDVIGSVAVLLTEASWMSEEALCF